MQDHNASNHNAPSHSAQDNNAKATGTREKRADKTAPHAGNRKTATRPAASRPGAAQRGAQCDGALNLENFQTTREARVCDAPGCRAEAGHRAPKSPSRLQDYFWFCLDHVRAYNKAWNYYADMSDNEVEHAIRRAVTWERPSWPFGTRPPSARTFARAAFRDAFGIFGEGHPDPHNPGAGAGPNSGIGASGPSDPEETRALAVMGMTPPATLDEVKACYKNLVKMTHPDHNGGDKEAEERLKLINEAYTTLKRLLK